MILDTSQVPKSCPIGPFQPQGNLQQDVTEAMAKQISQPVAPPHTGHKHTSYPTQQSLHPIGPQLKASNPNTRNRKVSTYMQTINRLRWFHRLWNESYLVQAPTQNRSSPRHLLTLPSLFWKQTVSLPARTLPKQSIIIIIYSSRADFNTFWVASNVASYGPMAFLLAMAKLGQNRPHSNRSASVFSTPNLHTQLL